jgi:RNA polymerase primary sigma factor
MPAPVVIGPDSQPIVAVPGAPIAGMQPPQTAAPATAPVSPIPFKPAAANGDGEERPEGVSESDLDDDDMENSLSLAAIEAELKPKVVETFDTVADTYKRCAACRNQDIQFRLHNQSLTPAQERKYKSSKKRSSPREVAATQPGAHRFPGRAALRHQQAPGRLRGPPDAACREPRRRARIFSRTTRAPSSTRAGSTASKLSAKGWKSLVARDKDKIKQHRTEIHVLAGETGLEIQEFRKIVQMVRRASAKPARPRRKW